MGLFINNDEHPEVYKNTDRLVEPNQVEYRRDHLTELLEKQMNANEKFQHSVVNLQQAQTNFNQQQLRQWRYFDIRLRELKDLDQYHEKLEQQIIDKLATLENQTIEMKNNIQHENSLKNDLLKQVSTINHSQKELSDQINSVGDEHKEVVELLQEFMVVNNSLMERIEQVAQTNEQMQQKLEDQSELNEQIITKISCVEESQKDVLDRVDNQEGLIEKMMRQIDNLRAILFERSNYIEEKVEKVFQSSAAFFQKNNSD